MYGRNRFRTYVIQITRKSGIQKGECDVFHKFVERITYNGREVLDFTKVSEETKCEIKLKVRCKSFGRTSPYRLTRNIELQFPDVTVFHVVRENNSN